MCVWPYPLLFFCTLLSWALGNLSPLQFDGAAVPRTDPWLTPTRLLGLLDTAPDNAIQGLEAGPLPVRRTWIYTPLSYVNATDRPDLVGGKEALVTRPAGRVAA